MIYDIFYRIWGLYKAWSHRRSYIRLGKRLFGYKGQTQNTQSRQQNQRNTNTNTQTQSQMRHNYNYNKLENEQNHNNDDNGGELYKYRQ